MKFKTFFLSPPHFSIGLVVFLFFFSSAQADFVDVPRTHPAYVAIAYFQSTGAVGGYSDGTFLPENSVNRAENAKMLLNVLNIQAPEVNEAAFKDIQMSDWFNPFVAKGKELGIINGRPDGTFDGAGSVNQVEMLAMLLRAYGVDVSAYEGGDWYDGYLNYARQLGIVPANMSADHPMTRQEVMEVTYLFTLITKGKDAQFLLTQAEAQMAQIEVYVTSSRVDLAKETSELAVGLTQQVLSLPSMRENSVALGAAKLAWAYDQLVQGYALSLQDQFEEAAVMVNAAIDEATKAWQANSNTQPIAGYIKDRACEVYWQLPQPLSIPEHEDCVERG